MKNQTKTHKYATIPHGKYRGSFLKDVPDEYVLWVILKSESRQLLDMFYAEFKRRNLKIKK
jgi:uncharacterized protein (DUF3820 family)